MITIRTLLLSAVFATCSTCMAAELSSLDELEWQHRIIIVKHQTADVETLFSNHEDQIKDRDIVWFFLADGLVETNYEGSISKQLLLKLERMTFAYKTQTILIGKDGTIKAKQNELSLDKLFALIDTMPMRIQELEGR